MKMTFTLYDIKEISCSTYRAFISTFKYQSEESDSVNSDSELSDFDPEIYGCGEITPEVESIVSNNWRICDPLDEVYGNTASKLIKETVNTATEETQCAGLKFFKHITPGEDRDLISICTDISFWCCCETIKRVSSIIAEATTNLMY